MCHQSLLQTSDELPLLHFYEAYSNFVSTNLSRLLQTRQVDLQVL